MLFVVLVLLLCVTLPILILAALLIYCLLSRQIKANEKLSSTNPTTISTVESATVETVPNASRSNGCTTVAIGNDNVMNADEPASAIFSFTRTPFGTRTTATFDLGSSLRASWTTDGQSQGPDTLAAALEGVLALHRRLEDLRLQQTNGHNIKEIEGNI